MSERFPTPKKSAKSFENYHPTDFTINAEKAERDLEKKAEAAADKPAESISSETQPEQFGTASLDVLERVSNGRGFSSRKKVLDNLSNLINRLQPNPEAKTKPKAESKSKVEAPKSADKASKKVESPEESPIKVKPKFGLIEKVRPLIEAESQAENVAAAKYFDLEKKSHSKDKKLRPTKEALAKAEYEYRNARIERSGLLKDKLEEEIKGQLSGIEWENKIRLHYDKLTARKNSLKNKKGKIISFEEYKNTFEKRSIDRYKKIAQVYELGLPHAERKLAARVERLGNKEKNVFQKGLGWVHQKTTENQNAIANSLVGKSISIGSSKIVISPKYAQMIGKYTAKAATSLAVSGLVAGGVAAGGAMFGVMTGSAALAYLGVKGWQKFGSIGIGTVGGVGAGMAFQKYAEMVDAKNLKKKKRSVVGSERSLKEFDKLLEIGTPQAIARRRQIAEMIGASAATLSVSAEHLYELTNHLSTAQAAAETLAAVKNVAEGTHHAPSVSVHEHIQPHSPAHPEVDRPAADHPEVVKPGPNAVPEAPHAASAPEKILPEISIAPGQGADHLFWELHKALKDQPHSPLTDSLLKSNPHVLAKSLGFPEHNSEGYMQPGDSLKIIDHKLMFGRHGRWFRLMEETTDKKGNTIAIHSSQGIEEMKGKLFPKVGHPELQPKPHIHLQETPPADPAVETSPHIPANGELPDGMDPDGVEAAEYLDKSHNPGVFNTHAPASTTASTVAEAPSVDAGSVPSEVPSSTSVATPSPEDHSSGHVPEVAQEQIISTSPVEQLTHSTGWDEYKEFPAQWSFETPVTTGIQSDIAFRQSLFDLLKKTGVGPAANEDVASYVSRASEALKNGVNHPMSIIQTRDNHLLVRGGDMNAQIELAREYGRIELEGNKLDLQVLVENSDKQNPGYIVISNNPNIQASGAARTDVLKLSSVKLSGNDKIVY